jgi:hypothetical protein
MKSRGMVVERAGDEEEESEGLGEDDEPFYLSE